MGEEINSVLKFTTGIGCAKKRGRETVIGERERIKKDMEEEEKEKN